MVSSLHGDGNIFHISGYCTLKLTPDLWGQLWMGLQPEQFQEGLFLLCGQVCLVALDQSQEALVPEHRQFALLLPEPQEVEDEGVKHMVGQSVLLIQQQSQEDAVGTTVFHLGDFQHGRTGVQHRDGALGDDATHDDGFPEGTGA